MLVVGGGDRAAEAALAVAAEQGTTVTVSCRGDDIYTRPKEKNRKQLRAFADQGKVKVLLNANVKQIGTNTITIDHEGKIVEFRNDALIVCAGGTLPTPMLKEIGIMVQTYYGTAVAR
ncbi:MAG: FAD-dependent oxidoreductase [Nitrospira sp.]